MQDSVKGCVNCATETAVKVHHGMGMRHLLDQRFVSARLFDGVFDGDNERGCLTMFST